MTVWLIATRSGPRYVVGHDAEGVWWFGGENVPNPVSESLPPRHWRIETPTPWPPLLGAPAFLNAAQDLDISDPTTDREEVQTVAGTVPRLSASSTSARRWTLGMGGPLI